MRCKRRNTFILVTTLILTIMFLNSCDYNNRSTYAGISTESTTVTLTLAIDGQGILTGSKSGEYEKGSKITIVATPQKTEYGESVFLYYKNKNGKVLSKNKNYSFNISEDATIIAYFLTQPKEAPSMDEILNKMSVERINQLYDHKRIENALGFSDHKEYYYTQEYKVNNGIIYESPWYSDATTISLRLDQIDKKSVSKSVTNSISIGLGITLFDILSFDIVEYQQATTITEITEQTRSLSQETTWNLKEFSDDFKYKIVVIGDYYINKELYIWDGFLLIGHDETISYFMELINVTDVCLVKEKKMI